MRVFDHDVMVSGSLTAGNIRSGRVNITTTTGEAAQTVTVTGVVLAGTGFTSIVATPRGTSLAALREVTVSAYGTPGASQFQIHVMRSDATTQNIVWFAMRRPS